MSFDHILAKLRSLMPKTTSLLQMQLAQSNLLTNLCPNVSFESRTSNNGLNYVIATKKHPIHSNLTLKNNDQNGNDNDNGKFNGNGNGNGKFNGNGYCNGNGNGNGNGKKGGTLILLHGYGAGLGMFFTNYSQLCETYDRVIAIDWMGMGGSKRSITYTTTTTNTANTANTNTNTNANANVTTVSPLISGWDIMRSFLTDVTSTNTNTNTNTYTTSDDVAASSVDENTEKKHDHEQSEWKHTKRAESFFVDPLHEFLTELTLTESESGSVGSVIPLTAPVDIAAHSLGGYLAFRYLQRYHQYKSSSADATVSNSSSVSNSNSNSNSNSINSSSENFKIRGLILISPCGINNHPPMQKQLQWDSDDIAYGFKLVKVSAPHVVLWL